MAVDDACKLTFLELKAKRAHRFIVFKIEEKQKQVIVEKSGQPELTYDDFTASLPADECRYAVFDFDYFTDENVPKSRIFFLAWSPDTARVRNKMIYASSKDRFKRELDGIQVELQYGDSGGEPASVGVCRLSRRGRRVSVFGLCGDAAATTYDGTMVIACGDFGGLECVGRDERDRRHGMAIVRARNDDCVD
ncbi:hypothetical protein ACFE04_002254 [Oxalis oulophora]